MSLGNTENMVRYIKVRLKKIKSFYPCLRGYRVLEKLQSDGKTAVFITSYAVGDLVYGMSIISSWKVAHPDYKVIIITDPKKKEIIESFTGYDEVIYWGQDTRNGYDTLVMLNGSRYFSEKGRKDFIFNTIPIQIYGYKTGKGCLALLKEYLGLPKTVIPQFPKPTEYCDVKSISDFENNKEKIIVINPYSNYRTFSDTGKQLQSIAIKLKERGYLVYSNVVGNQKPLPGTEALYCSLMEFFYIANNIPMVVAERSGIVDWIISTKSKKVVLYPIRGDQGLNDEFIKEMFSLYEWGITNCKEIYLNETTESNIYDAVLTFLND